MKRISATKKKIYYVVLQCILKNIKMTIHKHVKKVEVQNRIRCNKKKKQIWRHARRRPAGGVPTRAYLVLEAATCGRRLIGRKGFCFVFSLVHFFDFPTFYDDYW